MIRTFDPFRTPVSAIEDLLVIHASAGTGKTWTITHLAARWMVEEDHEPAELLLATFSRSAAAELKIRLRQRLTEFVEALSDSGESRSEPWVLALRDVAPEERQRRLARATRALHRLDDVHARTIHSFAAALRGLTELEVSDGRVERSRAINEEITRQSATRSDSFDALVERLEDSRATPGAVTLADRLADALAPIEGVGGLERGRVQFDGEADEVALAVLEGAARRATNLRRREHRTSYDELIARAADDVISNHDGIANALAAQFHLVLVDEFQDTDAVQWEIFNCAFRQGEVCRPVIVVGDPKQAIYGFRGGDVEVFSQVLAEARAADNPRQCFELELAVNYRSHGKVIDALNELFDVEEIVPWSFGTVDSPITYSPVRACDGLADRPGRVEIREDVDADTNAVLSDVTRVIGELVAAGTRPRDIAVLSARGTTLRSLARRLSARRIPTVTTMSSSVADSPACAQLRAWLHVLSDPTDARRRALLMATWFADVSHETLTDLGRSMANQGVGLFMRVTLSREVLARIRQTSEPERHWTDLEHLVDLLTASTESFNADELASRLNELVTAARQAPSGDDVAQRRIESDLDAVRLLTIHAAKGLEFPIVLLPDLEARPRGGRTVTWVSGGHRHIDGPSLTLDGDGASLSARVREEAEARRLIYVALTRAQKRIIAWRAKRDVQWAELVDATRERALHRVSGPIGAKLLAHLDDEEEPAPVVPPTTPQRREPIPIFDERTWRWSYSSLTVHAPHGHELSDDGAAYDAGAFGELDSDDQDPEVLDPFGGLRGTVLGNAVHRIFERLVGRTSSSDHDGVERACHAAWREFALSPVEVAPTIERRLARVLGGPFGARSLDSLVGSRDVATEMRFTLALATTSRRGRLARLCALAAHDGTHGAYFAEAAQRVADGDELAGGYLHGSLDLVCDAGDQRFVILDYKTNDLGAAANYRDESLTRAMANAGYPLQALLYSIALHRHLRAVLTGYDPARHLGGLLYYFVRCDAEQGDDGLARWSFDPDVITAGSDLLGDPA